MNLKLIKKTDVSTDETSSAWYEPTTPTSVKEVCEYAIKEYEWGRIRIIDDNDKDLWIAQIEYWHGNYCDSNRKLKPLDFSQELLDKQVKFIYWNGGWGSGDFYIHLK